MLEFAEWLPDIADFRNQGSTEAKNVRPTPSGFEQFNRLNGYSSALNSYCRGMFSAKSSADVSHNYAGSGSKLYQLVDGTWTDQSKASGTYSVSSDDFWEFAKWGETIIAIGGINTGTPVPPQVITMGAPGSTEFADLGGSPPQARHIGIVRDFILLGNLYESATKYPSRIRWSGINDSTHWATSPGKQSDYQDLQGSGGWIQAVRGGEYGVIFQERSIWRMDYIGPPLIFSFNETQPGVGTPAPNSIVQLGDHVFFWGRNGFQALTNGTTLEDIGKNKIDKWISDAIDDASILRMVGAVDFRNRQIVWIFPGRGNADGVPNEGVIFDLKTGKWSHFEADTEWISAAFGEGYTLDGLDAIDTDLDSFTASLDSRLWVGGASELIGVDSAHKSGSFEGTALDAVLETKEDRLTLGRTFVSKVRPEVESANTITVAPGTRDALDESVSWGSASSAERDNSHAMRSDARYHRFRASISGGFTQAQGITVVEASTASKY